ncbi:hypothetical protein [Butyrivibrio sp. WCD3002]|uniref:hypothetical protein n=1 Tax=Butyrivibrio sp. WCD3002 TaxID=1280676 RepID=UPI00047933C9|nr:hypothetical protein [Butyrivibrio sp. WCD3002]
MYDRELRRVTRALKIRHFFGRMANKEIYLFGVSDNTRQIIQILRELGVEPLKVIDNDKQKQGSYCSRLEVIDPRSITDPSAPEKLYILYSNYWREMIPQLTESGISSGNIWSLNPKIISVILALFNAGIGKIYRRSLLKKYGDLPIFLCPYTGTGDIYLIGTFWDEYIKRNGIDNYIFVVITGACKKVTKLFDIKNVELVKKKYYASCLIYYYMLNREKGYLKILNDCWPQVHTNQVEWFRGYKGLYFTELFRKYVFDLPDDVKPQHPAFKDESDRVGNFFDEYELQYNKTVALSPYSNTLSDLPIEFWEKLVEELVHRGYSVVTNSSGKTETAIKGTKGIFFPLDIAPQFIEAAGTFIGIRSGFCDVISGAKAKKIILYDAGNRFYMDSAFAYFSLKTMELCDDALELEFDVPRIDETLKSILGYLD